MLLEASKIAFEEHLFERFSHFKNAFTLPPVLNVTSMDDTRIFGNAYNDEDVGAEADFNNLETTMNLSPIPTTRIDKDHPKDQIIVDFNSAIQTRRMTKISDEHAMVCYINKQRRTNHKDYQNYLFSCFLSQMEESDSSSRRSKLDRSNVRGASIISTLEGLDTRNLPNGKMGHLKQKWSISKQKYERGRQRKKKMKRSRSRSQEHDWNKTTITQQDSRQISVEYDQALKNVLDKMMDQEKEATEQEEPYMRLKGDILLVQVYVDDIIFGSTKKSLCDEFEQIMHNRFQMSSMGELTFFLGLQVKQKEDGIFISQDKYVGEILKKFGFFSIRSASTPMETHKALTKDEDGEDVDVHLYRSMIGSLMYLTSSRPDIMFSVCACSRFQVQPKVSHLNAVKRIFRYLKGQPKLGLWYPKDSPLILEDFSDSDYAGDSLDRISIIGGCQFLGLRLISWQCKKQTMVANSTTEAEYITKIHVDNESVICVIKNPVYHSKTKHIEIRHHFIRDSYEKKLIEMVKIHTDHNVADLLTKAFDVGDEAVHKELGDRIERAATIASSLETEQAMSNDPPLSRVNTLRSGEDSMKLIELMAHCTKLSALYALTENPTIYVSFIKQFWKTATARTSANGEVELTATIDGQVKTITEASLRRHLKLEDNGSFFSLVENNISPSLSPQHTPVSTPSTSQPSNTQPTPNAEEAILMPRESPLHNVHSLRRDEGSVSLNELMDLHTSLSKKVGTLENELQQTKTTYSIAITKLIFRVKKLVQNVKTTKARRRARIFLAEDEEGVEDPSK
ncbi:putative ribonuclease H-like domain-containing protein [Tanacetum coccineum]